MLYWYEESSTLNRVNFCLSVKPFVSFCKSVDPHQYLKYYAAEYGSNSDPDPQH